MGFKTTQRRRHSHRCGRCRIQMARVARLTVPANAAAGKEAVRPGVGPRISLNTIDSNRNARRPLAGDAAQRGAAWAVPKAPLCLVIDADAGAGGGGGGHRRSGGPRDTPCAAWRREGKGGAEQQRLRSNALTRAQADGSSDDDSDGCRSLLGGSSDDDDSNDRAEDAGFDDYLYV